MAEYMGPGSRLPTRDQPCYLIAGRGFAAVLDYVTLLDTDWGRDRIGDLPVVLAGAEDPWPRFRDLPMGQWPSLLCLPGFRHLPGYRRRSAFLQSAAFGRATMLEAFRTRPVQAPGRISHISRTTEGFLVQVDGIELTARYVDVCLGIGPPKLLSQELLSDPELVEERNGRPSGALPWRRIVAGEEFLAQATAFPQHGRICVAGGGTTGAWCVEVALAAGNRVTWISRGPIAGAFPGSLRNDALLAASQRGVRPLPEGLRPADRRLAWIEGAEVAGVSTSAGGEVLIALAPSGQGPIRRTGNGRGLDLERPVVCDQLVTALGQDVEGEGSVAHLVEQFIPLPAPDRCIIRTKHPEERPLGFQDETRRLRVLGASAFRHPAWRVMLARDDYGAGQFETYRESLCQQARNFPSITVAADQIAEANQWFRGRGLEVNVNTAPPRRLHDVLGQPVAEQLRLDRAQRITPYIDRPRFLGDGRRKTVLNYRPE